MKSLLLALALVAGCHVMPAPAGALDVDGLPRVYQFAAGMFRGPQPTAAQWVVLAHRYGIKSDIKLNTAWPGDGGHDELPAEIDIFDHPWQPLGPVSSGNVADTLYDLASAPKPVYVHCLHGEDRTGLLVGIYRVANRVPAAAAWGEMRAFGFHDGEVNKPGLPLLVETFERETGWKP